MKEHMETVELRPDQILDDGFGNRWAKCLGRVCGLEIVRPGKVQCDLADCGRRSLAAPEKRKA